MMLNDPGSEAEAWFRKGYNCAQSVFLVFAIRYGLDEITALKLASPLGGGVARRGEICGAVSGGLLALGLTRGAGTPEGKEAVYQMGQEFMKRFETRHQATLCRDLIEYDISQPENLEKARQSGIFQTRCPVLVRDAANLVQAMLDDTPG